MNPQTPRFQRGQIVSAVSDLYNDGSYPEAPADALLVEAGARGEIVNIGTHVETDTHIYLVEFNERIVVGCFEAEIQLFSETKQQPAPEGGTRSSRTMKVMIRKSPEGAVSAYVPKKDLEEPVVSMEKPEMWGGVITLGNGWKLELPQMAADTRLPITVEARKLPE